MPTFRHGKNTIFKVGTSGAPTVLTDISNTLDSVSYPAQADLAETTTFQSSAKSFMPGFPANNFSITGKFDATTDGVLSGLQNFGTPVAVQFRPSGTLTPGVSYDAAGGAGNPGVFLTNYSISAPVNDVVSFQADFTNNLAITRSTY
jgi:hypothetical protein